jgi:hypothetical protein
VPVSWWVLVLGWLLLLLLAVGLVVLVGLRVFRQGRALLAEIGIATERLTAAAEGRPPDPDLPATTPDGRRSSTRRMP